MNLYQKLSDHQRETLKENSIKYPISSQGLRQILKNNISIMNLTVGDVQAIASFTGNTKLGLEIFDKVRSIFIDFEEIEKIIKKVCKDIDGIDFEPGKHTYSVNGSDLIGDVSLDFEGRCYYEAGEYETETGQQIIELIEWFGLVELSNIDGVYYSQTINIKL